jgi:hypothetical protein
MSNEKTVAVHHDPVWRERSNFVIGAQLVWQDELTRSEQLYARRLGESTFEVCCIPFFVYDVALGDIVATEVRGKRKYVISRVVRSSGRSVFRVWFGDAAMPNQREVAKELEELGALLEWASKDLLAVDARDREHAELLAKYLTANEQSGRFVYEIGRSDS